MFVSANSTLYILTILLMIRFLSGRTYRVPVQRGITIKEFAQTVQNAANIKEGCIALMINGIVLDEEKTVDEYGWLFSFTVICRYYKLDCNNRPKGKKARRR